MPTLPPISPQASRKRPVNLTLNEDLTQQAKALSGNLSATVESLLAEYVARETLARTEQQRLAQACAQGWNRVFEAHGSYADAHSTL
ncbi:MAG: type II toxin-antitoxin system CcdA family antitoxin [Brachymonas sp.]|nr:type II toxin-antitoxin system CcdA family antitoxin [Brachymonas sp.]